MPLLMNPRKVLLRLISIGMRPTRMQMKDKSGPESGAFDLYVPSQVRMLFKQAGSSNRMQLLVIKVDVEEFLRADGNYW